MNNADAYEYLGRLIETMPSLARSDRSQQTLQWIARVQAHLSKFKSEVDMARLKTLSGYLVQGSDNESDRNEYMFQLYLALAHYEADAPVGSRGSFIPVGNSFDAHAAIGNLLKSAKVSALIVDPYMDERMLQDFVVLAPQGILVQLLTDSATVRPGFQPAARAFISQYGSVRPLEARLTSAKALHDRLIIVDGAEVWTLTQSLKDFAKRSPASIVKADNELSPLKVAAYDVYWKASSPI